MKKLIPENSVLIPKGAKLMFKGVIFDTYQWQQTLYDGSESKFEMLRRADTVAAICVVGDKILVIKDEEPVRGARIGFPGGRVLTGEDVQTAVQREVLEETGYKFLNWRLIKVWQPLSKLEWFIHYFVAWAVTAKKEENLDPGEKNTVSFMELDDFKKYMDSEEEFLRLAELIKPVQSVSELIDLPTFTGVEVDR